MIRNPAIANGEVANRLALVNTENGNDVAQVVHVPVRLADLDVSLGHCRPHALNLIADD